MKKAICLITSLVLTLGISNSIQAKGKYNVKRISGDNRYQTSINISNEFSSGTIENVIVTSGDDFPDALAGSVLSKKINAPILLVGKDISSSSDSIDYIKKHLNANGNVYILGGEGSVSSNYQDYLKSLGYKNITRLDGTNRFDTNKSITKSMNISKGTPIVLVNGYGFADALSISSIAASKGYPILMSNSDSLPEETIQELKDIQPNKVYIIGGKASLSDNINNQVKNIISSLDDSNIVRVGGVSRYDTSLNVCKYFNINTNTAIISNGENFPDALSGSALAAKLNAPIILTNGGDISTQKSFIDSSNYTNLILLGGQGAISQDIEDTLNGVEQTTLVGIDSLIPYEQNESNEMDAYSTVCKNIWSNGTPFTIRQNSQPIYTNSILGYSQYANSSCYKKYVLNKNYDSISGVFAIDDMTKQDENYAGKVKIIIYGDDEKLYESNYLKRGDDPIKVNVNLKDKTYVTIKFDVQNDFEHYYYCSSAEIYFGFMNVILKQLKSTKNIIQNTSNEIQANNPVGVSSLTAYNQSEDSSDNYLKIGKNVWNNGNKFTIRQVSLPDYENSILGYSYYYTLGGDYYKKYCLNKNYDSISGIFAIDDMTRPDCKGKVKIIIYGDDEKLYESDYLKRGNDPIKINVNLKDKTYVTIKFDVENDTVYSNADAYFGFMNVILNKVQ